MSNFNFTQVNDEDKSLQSKVGGKFGLNKAKFSFLGFTDKAGKDDTPGNAFDINIMVGDKEFRTRIFDITGSALYGKDNAQIQPGEDGYETLFNDAMSQNTAVIKHALKATGVTSDVIDKALVAAKPTDFVSYAQVMTSLVPANYKSLDIYAFLEYQWNIREGQDKTFLILPKNMKGGYFLTPVIPGIEVVEVKTEDGLSYTYKGSDKPFFERDKTYMESPKANQQNLTSAQVGGINTPTGASAGKSEW